MKVGAENKKKAIAAGSLLLVAVSLFFWEMRSPVGAPSLPASPSASASAAPVATEARNAPAPQHVRSQDRDRGPSFPLAPSLDPRLRLDLLKGSEDVQYGGNGVNIFAVHADPVLDPIPQANGSGLLAGKPGEKPAPPEWVPPAPPPPPPINLRFYGWASKPGEPLAVFLSQGE
jgi:hypothetical protein